MTNTTTARAKKVAGNRKKQNAQEKETTDKDEGARVEFVVRYTASDMLAEAVLVRGEPLFLLFDRGIIRLAPAIELGNRTLKPMPREGYIAKAYAFDSDEQLWQLVEKCKTMTLQSMYGDVKAIWRKYIDADDFHLSICTATTIFAYFQDKVGLTHYLYFIGNNNSGKSNNLRVLHFLAYRNMMSTDITAANIYQMLGNAEEGIATLCEDEADDIDENREKMKIYKNGYTSGFKVMRIDTSNGRKQQVYNTFCFKAFAAERLPDIVKAKGFNQRIVELPCVFGFPQYDISEVVNPAGEKQFQFLLDELNDMRNSLLIYRILNHNKPVADIALEDLTGREKQIFGAVIRLFQNSPVFDELLPVISKYVSKNREKNVGTFPAYLYRHVVDLIDAQNTLELPSSLIWNTLKETLEGDQIKNKPMSYMSAEFGELSQKEVVEALKQVFGAEKSKNKRDSRRLLFNMEKLDKIGKLYNLSVDVRVRKRGADETDVAHSCSAVGIQRYGADEQLSDSGAQPKDDFEEDSKKINENDADNNKDEEKKQVEDGEGTEPSPADTDAPHVPQAPDITRCEICCNWYPADELLSHQANIHSLFGSE